jgi:hypothetical protein
MKKISLFTSGLLCALFLSGNTYHVTNTGLSANSGISFAEAMDFSTALSAVSAGDSILMKAGTYTVPYIADEKNTITLSKSGSTNNPISIVGYNDSIAVFDFSFPSQQWVQDSYGFDLTGSYWYFRNIAITRAGYQGVYVSGSYNTFENCAFYNNRNTGLEINKGGSYTTVINCDAYKNYDPKKLGGMADGFASKQTQGPGNTFTGCRSWENSDDGYDCYDSPYVVTFENSWAFRNGVDIWQYGGFDGNANGFKVGGNQVAADNILLNCVAFGHPNKGFDQNNNAGSITVYNCTGYLNGNNFGFGNPVNTGEQHILKNNISYNGPVSISNALTEKNSWNLGYTITDADFISLDTSLATLPRDSWGNLQITDLFQLSETSMLIDAGTDVGIPYLGNAPDLGYAESSYSRASSINESRFAQNTSITNFPNPARNIANFVICTYKADMVRLSLYNLHGKEIVIITEQYFSKGTHHITFDGSLLNSGIYLYKLETDNKIFTKKLIISRQLAL